MKKRIVSILLAVVMIIGIIPFSAITAFAEEEPEITEYFCFDVNAGAYIETDIKPSSTTRVVMDAEAIPIAGMVNLFGVYKENYYFYVNDNTSDFGASFGSVEPRWRTPFVSGRHTIELDRNVLKLDGETKFTFDDNTFECTDPMYLFALNFYGESVQFQDWQRIRFYSCQIYQNDDLKYNFVPAKDGSTFGVLDKKSGAFHAFKYQETETGTGVVSVVERKTHEAKTATCTEDGWEQYYEFEDKYYEDKDCTKIIPDIKNWTGYSLATGVHTWEIGETEHTCSVCKKTESHTWEIGETGHTCSVCEKNESHTWEIGETEHTCSVCKKTESHTWEIGETEHTCSVCEETEDHTWEIGETEHTCSVCGKTESHNWVNDTNSETQHKCSFCGATGEHSFVNGECTVCGRIKGQYISRSWDDSTKEVVETENDIPSDATAITSGMTELKGSWYVLASDVKLDTRIKVTGTVNIILMDGFTLTAPSGIEVVSGNTLNIYGQKGDSGKIVATGEIDNAGIGGERYADGGNVTVYGGEVTATGGKYGAGIGGGDNGNGGNVYIYGGVVTATGGGNGGAGIGGGFCKDGGTVTVYGGTVTAVGDGAGIGGGRNGAGGNVAVYGGTVNATGNSDGAGIGGNGGTVAIYGGTVNATGDGGAGIGGYHGRDGGDVTIYGGTVTATGDGGAGIGGGNGGGNGGTLTVYGGTVIATGDGGAGIGGGNDGNGGNVYIYGGVVTATGGGMGAQAIGRGAFYALYRESGSWHFGASAVIKAGADKDNANYTEYNGQPYVNIHWHNFVNGECTVCGGKDCEHTNRTVTSHSWSEDHSSCTLYWHCDDCNEDFVTVSTEVNLFEDEKGTCQTKGKGHYEATFDDFDTVIKTESKFDTELGDHNFVNYVCTCAGCTAEKVEDAKNDAKRAIQNAVDHSEDTIVLMLAETAKDAIDNAEKVAEVLKIRDLTVSQINAIKDINKAAGDNPIRKVKAVIDIAKEDIDSATSVEEVIGIRDECLADIKSLTGDVHIHTFADTYTHNDTHHWRVCTCEDEKCKNLVDDFAVHTFTVVTNDDGSKTYTCECGYTKTVYEGGSTEGEPVQGVVKCDGISLTLSSDIYINFYMQLTDEALANGKMVFTIGNRTVEGVTAQLNESNKRYYFACPLNALEMAETVKAEFTYGSTKYVQEYSVEKYVKAILGGDYTDEMKDLVRKIANYGYYAQLYLESIHTNVTIGGENGYKEMLGDFKDYISTDDALNLTDRFTASPDTANLTFDGRTVYFDSATALNFYVITKDGKAPTATCDKGKTVEIKKYSGNTYIVSVKDITATELADTYTVTVSHGGDTIKLKGSVLDYCAAVMNAHRNKTADKDVKAVNAMAAFYEYYDAAVKYVTAASK